MAEKTALLLGASGLVGGFCLDFLLAEPGYDKVVVLVRRPLQKNHPKLEQHIINFDQPETYQSFLHAEDVYSCLGTTVLKSPNRSDYFKIDFSYPFEIAKIAKENGTKQFSFVSALSANPKSWFFYSRVKGKFETAIIELGFESIQMFRPSYLVGERIEFRPIEKIGVFILKCLSPFMRGGLKKFRPIEAKAVAYAMVKKSIEHAPGVHIWFGDQMQEIWDKR